jgi:hypothetical protein
MGLQGPFGRRESVSLFEFQLLENAVDIGIQKLLRFAHDPQHREECPLGHGYCRFVAFDVQELVARKDGDTKRLADLPQVHVPDAQELARQFPAIEFDRFAHR